MDPVTLIAILGGILSVLLAIAAFIAAAYVVKHKARIDSIEQSLSMATDAMTLQSASNIVLKEKVEHLEQELAIVKSDTVQRIAENIVTSVLAIFHRELNP